MKNKSLQVRSPEGPLLSLQKEMNRMFERFFRGGDLWPFGEREMEPVAFYPEVDVIETDSAIRVKAELPDMEEKDIHVSFSQNTLMIKSEKKQETEDKGKNYHQLERRWGSFYRSILLPMGIDATKADAAFKKGVLTITLPKTAEAKKKEKEIPVHA